MSAVAWQDRLNEASTREDVVLVVQDFLALWNTEEIAQLPSDCVPGTIENAAQVNSYALKLARRHTIWIGDVSALHRMATFFTRAALRVFQINDISAQVRAEKREGGRASS
jgi:hypothetical protein